MKNTNPDNRSYSVAPKYRLRVPPDHLIELQPLVTLLLSDGVRVLFDSQETRATNSQYRRTPEVFVQDIRLASGSRRIRGLHCNRPDRRRVDESLRRILSL